VAELQNNLLVFEYLQQHPGTPQEKLPGVLLWEVSELTFSTAASDAARESGVIALMPREEIEPVQAALESGGGVRRLLPARDPRRAAAAAPRA
jgi:hypothetical protein